MIALGAVAFDPETGKEYGRFYSKIKPLADASVHKETFEWWTAPERIEMWRELHTDAEDADEVMREFDEWVRITAGMLDATPVAAAWKPGFDIGFLRYYAHRFLGRDTFGRSGSGFDIKTLATIAFGKQYSQTSIGEIAKEVLNNEHNHNALDDAVEQKEVFMSAFKRVKKIAA